MTKFSKSIASGVPTFNPPCVFQGPDESVYVTTGLSRGYKWDRRSASALDLGIDAPRIGPTMTTPTTGNSEAGDYLTAYRWLDRDLQPGSLSPTATVTAASGDRFVYAGFQEAPSTRITASHQGYVQLWRTAVDTSRVVYTVYGTGPAFSVSATANDEGYSKYTLTEVNAGDIAGLKAGDVVVISGHSNSLHDGQQTILKVVFDDKTITTDKGYVASGTGTATQRHFYFAYAGAIASHADSGGQVLFTTTLPHRLPVGAVILVSGSGVAGYNTTHKVRTVPTPYTFTTDQSYSAGTLGSSTVYRLTGFGNSTDNNDGDEISDANLTAGSNISMTILNDDGELIARRFNPPPNWKAVAVPHQDRAWYGVDIVYGGTNAAGQSMTVAVTQGDRTITGTNTAFTSAMVGRYAHIDGESIPKLIQKVTSATVLEVDEAITRANASGLSFQIIPPPRERNKLYYCCDADTEILTKRGWLRHDQLIAGDMALTLNPSSRQIEWQPVRNVNRQQFRGFLNRWKSAAIDALTTDDHRWLAEGCGVPGGHWTLRKGMGHGASSHFVTTSQVQRMTSKKVIIGGGIPVENDLGELGVTDDQVELSGWYITEGTNSKGPHGMTIGQSWHHNPEYCHRLNALAVRMASKGGTATVCKTQRNGEMGIWYFGVGAGDAVRALCPNKQLTPEYLCRLSSHQLGLLYETLMKGDGHVRGKTSTWSQKNADRCDGFQMLCAMLGKKTGVSSYQTKLGYKMHHVRVHDRNGTWPHLNNSQQEYCGVVWCPETPNGTWMARRNGETYWTGNSHPQEPESVPATNVITVQENCNDNDHIVGLMPHGAVLYVAKERHTYRVSYSRQPRLDATPTLAYSRGLLNHRCWVSIEDDAYCMDQSGIYMVPLWGSDHLSRDGVQHTVRPLLDFVYDNKMGLDKLRWSFVSLDSERRQIRFWVPQATWCSEYAYDSTLLRPKTCFVYNLDTQSFDLEGYVHQMGGGCLLPVNGRMRAILGGQRDLVYMMDDDLGEGTDTVLSGTVAGYNAGTPSITLASDPGITIDGAPVCITSGTGKFQVRRAVSRSGAVVTLDQAFSTAPTTSSTYRVGGVLCRARTGQFSFPDSSNSKKGDMSNRRGMRIAYQPFSDTFDVRFYRNHSSTAMNYTVGTNHGMGITTTSDEPDAVVDASLSRSQHGSQPGYSIVEVAGGRLHSDSYGDRWLGVELRCVRGADRPKFYGMELFGCIPHPGSGEGK